MSKKNKIRRISYTNSRSKWVLPSVIHSRAINLFFKRTTENGKNVHLRRFHDKKYFSISLECMTDGHTRRPQTTLSVIPIL